MKFLSRVVWSEGMYLGPHHFQSQSRYFEDSVHFAIEHAWFEPWGLISYKLDQNAIKNGRVSVLNAQGIFEDGLAFDMPLCDALPVDRDIRELFSPIAESLLIYLAIPACQSSMANCDVEGKSLSTRYRAVSRPVKDVNDGSEEKEVQLGQKNIHLAVAADLDSDLQAIPIARIKRDGSGNLIYDPEFIPPCIKLTASEWLMAALARLLDVFEEKRKVLMSARKPANFQSGANQAEVSNFWFLNTINQGLATIRHMHLCKRGHPEELFRELLQVAGALCTFNVESDSGSLPLYDHRHLDVCFSTLMNHILGHLEIMVPSNAIEICFERTDPNFYVAEVKDQRCFAASRWVLGLGSSAGEAQVLTRGPQLVKMCSRLFVGELVKRAMPGLVLTSLNVPPSALPAKMELQYFNVDKSGPCWNHIRDSRQIGIYVPNELPDAKIELYVILQS